MSETTVKIKEISEDANLESIWKTMDANIKQTLPFMEQTIDQWNDRNQAIKTSNQKNKNLNKTIIQQVNLMLNDEELYQKTLKKSQYKRETYKTMGLNEDDYSYLD